LSDFCLLTGRDWALVEEFISSIERRSYSASETEAFYSRSAEELARVCHADAVEIRLLQEAESRLLAVSGSPPGISPHGQPDADSFRPGETRCLARNTDSGVLLSADHAVEAGTILTLSLTLPATEPETLSQLEEVLGTLAVLCGNFHLRQRAAALRRDLEMRERVASMIRRLADSEQSPHAEAELCRSLQETLEIDRVSLVQVIGTRTRILGTSATATVSRSSSTVRMLEQLLSQVHRQRTRLNVTVGGDSDPLPGEVKPLLDRYLDESTVRRLQAIPIDEPVPSNENTAASITPRETNSPSSPHGVWLVLEHFSADWPKPQQQLVADLALPHGGSAARRLLARHRSPLRRCLDWSRRRGPRWLVVLLAVLLIGFLLAVIPKELDIHADGTLMPVRRAAVFAPTEAIVEEILIEHGDAVTAGDVLVVLRNPELEIEERRISGEMATVRARLESVKAARIRNRASGSRQQSDAELSAQESDLQTQWDGLNKQLDLLHQERELLKVRSPITGRVDRWDLNQAFDERPVAHGQFLFDVLDVDGPWEIELHVPDGVAGYVLAAQEQSPCSVTYLYRTAPERKHESVIERISSSTRMNSEGKAVVPARVPVGEEDPREFRAGASVLAKVHCGPRPLGFVLFREVIEFFQRLFWI
jgi:hypothetical protein